MFLDLLQRIRFALLPPVFTVRFSAGTALLAQGKLPQRLVDEFAAIAGSQGICRGRIYGVQAGERIRLVFSPHVAPADQQRFRNCHG